MNLRERWDVKVTSSLCFQILKNLFINQPIFIKYLIYIRHYYATVKKVEMILALEKPIRVKKTEIK